MAKNQERGKSGELALATLLRNAGATVGQMPYNCTYDLQVDQYRVEVKTAKLRKDKKGAYGWQFNIHRHNKITNGCDFYVLCMQDMPYARQSVYLLMQSPLEMKTVLIGIRGFFQGQFLKEASAFDEWVETIRSARAASKGTKP